eukprot:867756-Rhodomonas_salina.3
MCAVEQSKCRPRALPQLSRFSLRSLAAARFLSPPLSSPPVAAFSQPAPPSSLLVLFLLTLAHRPLSPGLST